MLDHIATDNIKKDKYQHDDAIENEHEFDGSFNLSRGNKYPLPVVTVILRGGKKHRPTTVADLTFLWDSGSTNIMIKIRQTK